MARLSEKIGYGLGDMSSSMFWKIFSYYLPIFYTDVFGLTAGASATLLLVTKLYDAVSDPVMGVIADRTHTRWGHYRPYLLWLAIPFGIIGYFSFFTPDTSYSMKVIYAYVMYLLMMSVYTGINVPYGAMLGVVSPSSREKSVFSSYRMFFAYIGSFVAMGIFWLFEMEVGGNVSQGEPALWSKYVGIISIMCVVLFLGCFTLTRENVRTEPKSGDESGMAGVMRDLRALVVNKPWWLLLGGAIGLLLFGAMRGGAMAYYFTYVLAPNIQFPALNFTMFGSTVTLMITLAVFLFIGEISQMIGVTFTVPISERLGKKTTFALNLVAMSALSALIWFIPATTGGFWTLVILQFLICICIGMVSPLMWSMFADVADASELKNGTSSIGLIFSSSSMAQKFGGTLGGTFLMLILGVMGYIGQAPTQVDSAITAIRATVSWVPAIGTLLGLVCILYYPLTKNRMKEIDAKLKIQRAKIPRE